MPAYLKFWCSYQLKLSIDTNILFFPINTFLSPSYSPLNARKQNKQHCWWYFQWRKIHPIQSSRNRVKSGCIAHFLVAQHSTPSTEHTSNADPRGCLFFLVSHLLSRSSLGRLDIGPTVGLSLTSHPADLECEDPVFIPDPNSGTVLFAVVH